MECTRRPPALFPGLLARAGVAILLLATLSPASARPAAAAQPATHDWRAPGYVSVVGGRLFDPRCVPLESIGGNVPNLAYRDGLEGDLEWLRQHQLRWFRVVASGHALGADQAPSSAESASTRLRALLARVEAFNARTRPDEAIYVLVALTDYYAPGVPGDRQAFDHPVFKSAAVLPAPWYRAGVRSFDFDQEHGFGRLSGMPNYEVFYKPWVQTLVSGSAGSPALLGWQLGNELKARGSPRNGISSDDAYAWYLAFTRDTVDTIRALDTNHLVFTGTQYIAELVDWEYRPNGQLTSDAALLGGYRERHARLIDACGTYCWNVLGLTEYDFNPYALDDAALAKARGVATAMTEYGFTLGTTQEIEQRFGGDRAAAVRAGLARPWRAIDGQLVARLPSAAGLLESGLVDGLAPWASPAPGPNAGPDMDSARGITGASDETALWDAWAAAAALAEQRNSAAGPSAACQALISTPSTTAAAAPALAHDGQYFAQTGYRIEDQVQAFFENQGGIETFGYPVSRTFTFLGCPVQMFQRLIVQSCPGSPPALLNLLDPDIFPYTSVNGSTFPAPDDDLKRVTPSVGTVGYDEAMRAFVDDAVPDEFDDQPVQFHATFEARGGLSVWGAPISRLKRDPNNASFIYQRFQRGIMHYRAGRGTDSILLADYLKTVLLNRELPPDLAAQAQSSPYFQQYCPRAASWVCTPSRLPGTDLTFAFEPG
ncbi:MAG TPA: hypothetical protein VGL99_23530 [Chloroflexota bacterium]